ncbi:unnamed protein product [Musa textilis]
MQYAFSSLSKLTSDPRPTIRKGALEVFFYILKDHGHLYSWKSESDTLAAKCLVDLFVKFFDVMRSQLPNVVAIITSFLSSPYKQYANTGMAALLHLACQSKKQAIRSRIEGYFGFLERISCFNATCFFKHHQDHAKC